MVRHPRTWLMDETMKVPFQGMSAHSWGDQSVLGIGLYTEQFGVQVSLSYEPVKGVCSTTQILSST